MEEPVGHYTMLPSSGTNGNHFHNGRHGCVERVARFHTRESIEKDLLTITYYNSSILCESAPCCLVDIYRRFTGPIYRAEEHYSTLTTEAEVS
jgi:hypothetical protein